MSRSLLIGLIAVILIAGGGFLVLGMDSDDATTNNATTPTTNPTQSNRSTMTTPPSASDAPADTSNVNEDAATAATISYTESGFSPNSVTVKSGDSITIENTSEENVQFNSDDHPTHTENSELNVGMISAGESKSFTVTKKGSFGFHNHLDASQKGMITVE